MAILLRDVSDDDIARAFGIEILAYEDKFSVKSWLQDHSRQIRNSKELSK